MDLSDSWTARTVPIVRQSAAEKVFDAIRQGIEHGELPVGSKLPSEAALADQFAVSRTVIREALRSCQTLGLTVTKTGSGTFVAARFAARDLRYGNFSSLDLFEARPAIEVPAAGMAAGRRTQEDIDKLTELVDTMEGERDPVQWVHLDTELHSAIAGASSNAVYAKIVNDIRDALLSQSQVLNVGARRQQTSNREHRRVVRAIVRGDRAGAEKAMTEHLENVEKALRSILGQTIKNS